MRGTTFTLSRIIGIILILILLEFFWHFTTMAADRETPVHLGMLGKGAVGTIMRLVEATNHDNESVRTRLMELGFVPGEQVRVVAVSFLGRDPMAIRLGNSTFALRRHEASMIEVDLAGSASSHLS